MLKNLTPVTTASVVTLSTCGSNFPLLLKEARIWKDYYQWRKFFLASAMAAGVAVSECYNLRGSFRIQRNQFGHSPEKPLKS